MSIQKGPYERIAHLEKQVTSLLEMLDNQAAILKRLQERIGETQVQVNSLNRANAVYGHKQ